MSRGDVSANATPGAGESRVCELERELERVDVVSAFRVPSLADSLLFPDRDDRVSIAHAPFPSGTRRPFHRARALSIGHAPFPSSGTRPFSKPVVWDSTEDAPEARRTNLGGRRLVGVFFRGGFFAEVRSPLSRRASRREGDDVRRARSHLSRRLRASDARDSRAARGRVRARAASTQVPRGLARRRVPTASSPLRRQRRSRGSRGAGDDQSALRGGGNGRGSARSGRDEGRRSRVP